MDLKEIEILGNKIDDHWYYVSKANAMEKMINYIKPSKILDIGAGSGFFSRFLLNQSYTKSAICVDIGYSKNRKDHVNDKPMYFKNKVDFIDADLVLIMDVLEHVDNDMGLVREYLEKVPSGCKFLISVPAFEFLWSGHDEFLGHKRRYNKVNLRQKLINSGLKVNYECYFFSIVFPIALLLRIKQKIFSKGLERKSQLSNHSPIVNLILKQICKFELSFFKKNRFFGLTVFALAEKV